MPTTNQPPGENIPDNQSVNPLPKTEPPVTKPVINPVQPPSTPTNQEKTIPVKEEIVSLSRNQPLGKKTGKKKVILPILGLLLILAAIPAAIFLVKQRQELRKEAVQDQYQCVSGCDGQVCQEGDDGYTWCSKDKRCRCTGVGQAEEMSAQQWCEGSGATGNTMACKEITPGNCGTYAVSDDPLNCGEGQTGCNSYTDCFNVVECEWSASTYCIEGQCTCSDVAQQRAYGEPRGWAVCEDTVPKCTPEACPGGWSDCGLNYSRTDNNPACVKKVKCGPEACDACGNTYVVWRYCKPGGPTVTPPSEVTPTVTEGPTPTLPPESTPTPTSPPGPQPTETPTPTPVTLNVEGEQPGFALPTVGAILGGFAILLLTLLF